MSGNSRPYLWLSLILTGVCMMMLGQAIVQTIGSEMLLIQSPKSVIPAVPGYADDILHLPWVDVAHRANLSHLLVLLGALTVAVLSAILIRKAIIGKLVSTKSIRQNKAIAAILCVLIPLKMYSDSEQRAVEKFLEISRFDGRFIAYQPSFAQVDWGMFLIIPLALALSCLLHEAITMQRDLEGTV